MTSWRALLGDGGSNGWVVPRRQSVRASAKSPPPVPLRTKPTFPPSLHVRPLNRVRLSLTVFHSPRLPCLGIEDATAISHMTWRRKNKSRATKLDGHSRAVVDVPCHATPFLIGRSVGEKMMKFSASSEKRTRVSKNFEVSSN